MKLTKGLSAVLLLLGAITLAWAVQTTPTPPIPPNETGENSVSQQEIFNVSRLKPSFGTLTASGGPTAFTGTLNKTAGIVTLPAMTLAATGAGACPNTLTLTNNHIQAGDIVMAVLDSTASAAGAPAVGSVKVSANTLVVLMCNDSSTAMTASAVTVSFFVVSQGNGN